LIQLSIHVREWIFLLDSVLKQVMSGKMSLREDNDKKTVK